MLRIFLKSLNTKHSVKINVISIIVIFLIFCTLFFSINLAKNGYDNTEYALVTNYSTSSNLVNHYTEIFSKITQSEQINMNKSNSWIFHYDYINNTEFPTEVQVLYLPITQWITYFNSTVNYILYGSWFKQIEITNISLVVENRILNISSSFSIIETLDSYFPEELFTNLIIVQENTPSSIELRDFEINGIEYPDNWINYFELFLDENLKYLTTRELENLVDEFFSTTYEHMNSIGVENPIIESPSLYYRYQYDDEIIESALGLINPLILIILTIEIGLIYIYYRNQKNMFSVKEILEARGVKTRSILRFLSLITTLSVFIPGLIFYSISKFIFSEVLFNQFANYIVSISFAKVFSYLYILLRTTRLSKKNDRNRRIYFPRVGLIILSILALLDFILFIKIVRNRDLNENVLATFIDANNNIDLIIIIVILLLFFKSIQSNFERNSQYIEKTVGIEIIDSLDKSMPYFMLLSYMTAKLSFLETRFIVEGYDSFLLFYTLGFNYYWIILILMIGVSIIAPIFLLYSNNNLKSTLQIVHTRYNVIDINEASNKYGILIFLFIVGSIISGIISGLFIGYRLFNFRFIDKQLLYTLACTFSISLLSYFITIIIFKKFLYDTLK